MAVTFEKSCFVHVVGNMLGESYTEIDDEIKDAVGELCNQIFGLAKSELNDHGHDIQPALPTIIADGPHSIKHLVDRPCVSIQFETDHGRFTVEAALEEFGTDNNTQA